MTTNYENGGGAVDGTTYWVRIRAKDIAGNYSAWTSKCAITYDTTSPSIPSLSVTGSFTKAVEEKINNSDFETGDLTNWRSAGDVQVMTTDNGSTPDFTVTPYDGVYMTRIGQASSYVWENRLMGSFDSGAKSLSMRYNFFSRDAGSQDNPGFFIRLNGQEIFSLKFMADKPEILIVLSFSFIDIHPNLSKRRCKSSIILLLAEDIVIALLDFSTHPSVSK